MHLRSSSTYEKSMTDLIIVVTVFDDTLSSLDPLYSIQLIRTSNTFHIYVGLGLHSFPMNMQFFIILQLKSSNLDFGRNFLTVLQLKKDQECSSHECIVFKNLLRLLFFFRKTITGVISKFLKKKKITKPNKNQTEWQNRK